MVESNPGSAGFVDNVRKRIQRTKEKAKGIYDNLDVPNQVADFVETKLWGRVLSIRERITGTFLGRNNAERTVEQELKARAADKIFKGDYQTLDVDQKKAFLALVLGLENTNADDSYLESVINFLDIQDKKSSKQRDEFGVPLPPVFKSEQEIESEVDSVDYVIPLMETSQVITKNGDEKKSSQVASYTKLFLQGQLSDKKIGAKSWQELEDIFNTVGNSVVFVRSEDIKLDFGKIHFLIKLIKNNRDSWQTLSEEQKKQFLNGIEAIKGIKSELNNSLASHYSEMFFKLLDDLSYMNSEPKIGELSIVSRIIHPGISDGEKLGEKSIGIITIGRSIDADIKTGPEEGENIINDVFVIQPVYDEKKDSVSVVFEPRRSNESRLNGVQYSEPTPMKVGDIVSFESTQLQLQKIVYSSSKKLVQIVFKRIEDIQAEAGTKQDEAQEVTVAHEEKDIFQPTLKEFLLKEIGLENADDEGFFHVGRGKSTAIRLESPTVSRDAFKVKLSSDSKSITLSPSQNSSNTLALDNQFINESIVISQNEIRRFQLYDQNGQILVAEGAIGFSETGEPKLQIKEKQVALNLSDEIEVQDRLLENNQRFSIGDSLGSNNIELAIAKENRKFSLGADFITLARNGGNYDLQFGFSSEVDVFRQESGKFENMRGRRVTIKNDSKAVNYELYDPQSQSKIGTIIMTNPKGYFDSPRIQFDFDNSEYSIMGLAKTSSRGT